MTDDLLSLCFDIGRRSKSAACGLATTPQRRKDDFLLALADGLRADEPHVLAANDRDLAAAPGFDLSAALVDRLRLTPARLRAVAAGVRDIAAQPDPVGRILDGSVRPSGLRVERVSVPLGVVFFLYESRPNVTVDAAALAVKSGNAIILRGGKEAAHSNAALYRLIRESLSTAGLPADAVQLVPTAERDAVGHFLRMPEFIDLAIPRGGPSLVERVCREAAMPVMKHYRGNCHVYVDHSADLEMATHIIVNAKCQRPGVCNAAESLLVHAAVADAFLPRAAAELSSRGVELRGCDRTCRLVPGAKRASDEDYSAEYLALVLSVKVVDALDGAIEHIRRFGSGHTEAIVTADLAASRRFAAEVDAAAVMVNASTRFHDGGELGLGAEIGISTDKFHARGPCGLTALTSYKYVVTGDGQVRN